MFRIIIHHLVLEKQTLAKQVSRFSFWGQIHKLFAAIIAKDKFGEMMNKSGFKHWTMIV